MSDTKTTIHSISAGSIFKVILIIILFYTLFLLKDIVLTILTAIIIASAIEPGAAWF
jgi:predicted PurR-regulated permease PerM